MRGHGPHAGDLRQAGARQERVVVGGGQHRACGGPGAGRPHRTGARQLIEKTAPAAERAADALERTIVLHGDGLDMRPAERGRDRPADAMLAVTDDDKTNLLASVRAKSAGCGMAIALVNDPTLLPLMDPLGIDAYINPRATTVSRRSCAMSGTAGCATSIPSATPRPR
jgi:trk system potassium uptake protein